MSSHSDWSLAAAAQAGREGTPMTAQQPEFTDPAMDGQAPAGGHARVCGARLRQEREDDRTTCERPAGWGTPHVGRGSCRTHGGNTPSHLVAVKREQLADYALAMGVPVEIDPLTGVQDAHHRAYGQVLVWGRLVSALQDDQLFQLGRDGLKRPAAEVEAYAAAVREHARQSRDLVQLGIEGQKLRVQQAEDAMLAQVLTRVLERAGAPITTDLVARLLHEEFAALDVQVVPETIEGETG